MQISPKYVDALALPPANPVEAVAAYNPKPTYGFVRTREIVDAFATMGWQVAGTEHATVRAKERQGFQKHIVRLEHPDFPCVPGLARANESRPQLVMLNSHDRSTSFRLHWGLLRFACMNGIICGDWLGQLKVFHSANVVAKLAGGVADLVNNAPRMLQSVEKMGTTMLTPRAVDDFTRRAFDYRILKHGRLRANNVRIDYNMVPRRAEDQAQDLYTVYNRVQEACLRGGIAYTGEVRRKDGDGRVTNQIVARMSRKVASVMGQVEVNQAVHRLAMEYT